MVIWNKELISSGDYAHKGKNTTTFRKREKHCTDKLITLQHALKPVYRKNATWLMNDNTLER
jgi:HK97 family phage major capsid protein